MSLFSERSAYRWTGDYGFLMWELVLKDFRIRYRNMSLGIFWSLLNPLVLMTVYTFVFGIIFKSAIPHFAIHILCAIIPFNFFTLSWITATTSLVDNSHLIKRIPVRREVIPIAAILSNLTHLAIQLLLLVAFVLFEGIPLNVFWLWLPVVWGMELAFLIGLGLASSALNMFFRDIRYLVESTTLVLFWLVPAIYTFDMVPQKYRDVYQYNPLAALVFATQNVVLHATAPSATLLIKLACVSAAALAVGVAVFRSSDSRFYEYF